MKMGTENKKKTILAAVLGVPAIILVFWQLVPFFFGGGAAAVGPVNAPANSAGPAPQTGNVNRSNRNRGHRAAAPVVNTLDPTIRLDLLANA